MNKKKFLAIIPARAGSKRIFNKNLQLIGSKPMIQFTIEAAISSIGAANTIISSNDIKVHDVAKNLGLKVPFIRPDNLSSEKATTSSVVSHVLQWHQKIYGFLPDNIILLQPTSPFRTSADIKKSLKQFITSKKNTLVSACIPSQNPSDFLFKNRDGKFKRLNIFKNKKKNANIYFIDGGIYISKTKHFIKTRDLIGNNPDLFLMPQDRSIDIDTQFDLDIARFFFKSRLES